MKKLITYVFPFLNISLEEKSSCVTFTSRFFSYNTEKFFGSISGHFGPIRYININPDGKSFATASQDGTIRIYYFNDDHHPKRLCEQTNTELVDIKVTPKFEFD